MYYDIVYIWGQVLLIVFLMKKVHAASTQVFLTGCWIGCKQNVFPLFFWHAWYKLIENKIEETVSRWHILAKHVSTYVRIERLTLKLSKLKSRSENKTEMRPLRKKASPVTAIFTNVSLTQNSICIYICQYLVYNLAETWRAYVNMLGLLWLSAPKQNLI